MSTPKTTREPDAPNKVVITRAIWQRVKQYIKQLGTASVKRQTVLNYNKQFERAKELHRAPKDMAILFHATGLDLAEFQATGGEVADDRFSQSDARKIEQAIAELKARPDSEFGLDRLPPVPKSYVQQKNGPFKALTECLERKVHLAFLIEPFGGTGKSTLVKYWLTKRRKGSARTFVWSFNQGGNSQGTSDDAFIRKILSLCGVEKSSSDEVCDPWEKGQIAAEAIRTGSQQTLLVLDGLEALQHSTSGELRSEATSVRSLLAALAHDNNGLCIVTSRRPVPGLDEAQYAQKVHQIELPPLSSEEGAKLLSDLGVEGNDRELQKKSEEFGGHPLSLTLLASFLKTGGNTKLPTNVFDSDNPTLLEAGNVSANHLLRILESHAAGLEGKLELQVLKLASLFDPIDPAVLASVFAKEPIIAGLNDFLFESRTRIKHAIDKLIKLRLLTQTQIADRRVSMLPIVREFYAAKLIEAKQWKQAHSTIFDHFRTAATTALTTVARETDDLDRICFLCRTIFHACSAGRYEEGFDVFWESIEGERFIHMTQKGSYDLGFLRGFFDDPFRSVVSELQGWKRAMVLGLAGFSLRPCNLELAGEAMLLSRDEFSAVGDRYYAAMTSGFLAEIHWVLGNLPAARAEAEKSVQIALQVDDHSKRKEQTTFNRSTLATVLFLHGMIPEAQAEFRQAEKEFGKPLRGIGGARLCDLLIELGLYDEVILRAERALALEEADRHLLAQARYKLCLGRAKLLKWQHDHTADILTQSSNHIDQAIQLFRRSGLREDIPWGLLARARLIRMSTDWQRVEQAKADLLEAKAKADLTEARAICIDLSLKVDEVDCQLELALLEKALFNRDRSDARWESARISLSRANDLALESGYVLRTRSIQDLEKQLDKCLSKRPD